MEKVKSKNQDLFLYNQRNINIINSGKDIIFLTDKVICFSLEKHILLYEIDLAVLKYKLLSILDYKDDILTINKFNKSKDNIYIIGKSNKEIDLFKLEDNYSKFNLLLSYIHLKKISTFKEIENYLLFSDKFGEIHIKQLQISKEENKILNEESFKGKGKLLSGHADVITFMRKSKNSKLFLTSDDFCRIKIYQFPNLFNVLGVILYEHNSLKFISFIGKSDKCILIINNLNEIHLWSCYDFVLQNQYHIPNFDNKTDDILSVKISNEDSILFIETKEKFFSFNFNDNKYTINKVKEINKSEFNSKYNFKYIKIFIKNSKQYIALFNEKYELIHIQSI